MADILIVAQEEILCDLLELTLTQLGHSVEITDSGHEAFNRIRNAMCDALIIDNSMSDMTMLDFLKTPRGGGSTRAKVMALSDEWTPEMIVDCRKAGASDLLSKPFNLPDLLIRIEKLFETR